jgi:DNA-binding transcriptional ArsR family regulator
VVATLGELGGAADAAAIVAVVYPDLIEELVPRARQSVHAHLRKLRDDGVVTADDPDREDGGWRLAAP